MFAASRAPASFHARFDAAGKQYRYAIWNHTAMNPLLRARAWHVDTPWLWFFAASAVLFLMFAALKRGTRLLEG